MPEIVVNEWIFHDIKGENGPHAQRRIQMFLEAFRKSPFRMVVMRDSPWSSKAKRIMKEADAKVQVMSKFLHLAILIDPEKCTYLEADNVGPLPPELAEQIPADDAYLFQTALDGDASTIVTTDIRLVGVAASAGQFGIRIQLRDDFFNELKI
jgi:hypothetical protein